MRCASRAWCSIWTRTWPDVLSTSCLNLVCTGVGPRTGWHPSLSVSLRTKRRSGRRLDPTASGAAWRTWRSAISTFLPPLFSRCERRLRRRRFVSFTRHPRALLGRSLRWLLRSQRRAQYACLLPLLKPSQFRHHSLGILPIDFDRACNEEILLLCRARLPIVRLRDRDHKPHVPCPAPVLPVPLIFGRS